MARKGQNKKENDERRERLLLIFGFRGLIGLALLSFGVYFIFDSYETHKYNEKYGGLETNSNISTDNDISVNKIILSEQDNLLLAGNTKYELALSKGDTISIYFTTELKANSFIMKNINTGNDLLRITKPISQLDTVIAIRFPAIYQIIINSPKKQYADIKITNLNQRGSHSSGKVVRDTVMCDKIDEGAIAFKGLEFAQIYKEPQKNTMSSQGKTLFGGRCKVVIPVNLPKGTTVWAYQLRISTNKQDMNTDGKFVGNMDEKYKQIKIFGIPTYESKRKSTNIVREILNSLTGPDREEDAFCDFYVFNDKREADKFANGSTDYKCYREYSFQGTQSTQGEVPANGRSSFFIGLENTRFTTTIYTWIDAVATVPTTRYYKVNFLKE